MSKLNECPEKGPITDELLERMDKWFRAANYLSAGQLYLLENPLLRKPREQLRQQLHRVPGRGAPVVDVPGDQHRVWPKLPAQFQKAPDPVCLVPAFQQGYAVKALSQVQVRQMQKSHIRSPLFLSFSTVYHAVEGQANAEE